MTLGSLPRLDLLLIPTRGSAHQKRDIPSSTHLPPSIGTSSQDDTLSSPPITSSRDLIADPLRCLFSCDQHAASLFTPGPPLDLPSTLHASIASLSEACSSTLVEVMTIITPAHFSHLSP